MKESFFKKEIVTAKIRNPLKNFEVTEEEIEIRWDPLLQYTSRISKAKGLDKVPEDQPLKDFVAHAKACFFCEGRVETQTPMLPAEIEPRGRLSSGEALLFPNLSGFGRYSGVCIFSKVHFIPLEGFTPDLIFNALKVCRNYFQKCVQADSDKLYPSLNGNYLLPAGSSILHPHLQPFLDHQPTNFHRQLLQHSDRFQQENNKDYWDLLKKKEKNSDRFLFETEFSFVYTPFAPLGFNEINALIGEGEPFPAFNDRILEDIADLLQRIFQFYHRIRHNSFNLTLFSAPVPSGESMPCLLKICSRPVFLNFYRNDVTFFEKFHQEAMIDKTPEAVAAEFLG